MEFFRGILNTNNEERYIETFLNLEKNEYITDFYIDNIKYETTINKNIIEFNSYIYEFYTKSIKDEIFIIAKKKLSIYDILFNCMPESSYFVLTNK